MDVLGLFMGDGMDGYGCLLLFDKCFGVGDTGIAMG